MVLPGTKSNLLYTLSLVAAIGFLTLYISDVAVVSLTSVRFFSDIFSVDLFIASSAFCFIFFKNCA